MRLLYLLPDPWPTFRPDVVVLFGKYLPREGVSTDIVTHRGEGEEAWLGGCVQLYRLPKWRPAFHLCKLWHNVSSLIRLDRSQFDAVQVRGMSVHALAALIAARCKRLPFIYWMSFPVSEDQVARARAMGWRGGVKFWFLHVQGRIGG